MLPRGCCSCCQDDNEMAPRDRLADEDEDAVGCVDFCGSSRMSEGRQSQVVLLDDRRLDILIKPKLYAGELLDMVASHFNLKEKEYFGLAYADDTGHFSWLQLDRRVLEHDFPKRSSQSTLVLFFRIKYFVESITHLRDSATVDAFYLQTQSLVYNGVIDVSTEKSFQLAALVLQATFGDYTCTEVAKEQLKKLPVLPTSALIEHPSITVCEDYVIDQYRILQGQTRGSAVVNYMRIAESLPTYGIHYYEVKDKSGIPWWLGINYKGICQYDQTDRKVPRKLFLWKQLENLYFRDRKFSIEVNDPKRTSACRKTFGAGDISVYVWFASSPSLTKCIWSMAIAQHQFYLDRKHNKSSLSLSRNYNEIADELSHGSYSTETSSLGRSVSSRSLPTLKIDSDSCDEAVDTIEMFIALKARKEALEDSLHKKSEELKKLCLHEGELTGSLPPEMPLSPGEQIPVIKKKNGGILHVKDKLTWKKKSKDEEDLAQLELEHEIQSKIVNAAFKLSNDTSSKKNIRRQRKLSHQKAVSKLKEIEQRIALFRKRVESAKKNSSKLYADYSDENLHYSTNEKEKLIQATSENLSDLSIPFSKPEVEEVKNCFNKMTSSLSSPVPLRSVTGIVNSNSVPSSPSNSNSQNQPPITNKEKVIRPDSVLQGYTPSSVYQTQTSYRTQQYPTFSMRSPSSYSNSSGSDFGGISSFSYCDRSNVTPSLSPPYKNRFESTLHIEGSNLYSVPTQRTSQAFDTQDDILASMTISPYDLGLMSRHNSLDRNRRHSIQRHHYCIDSSQVQRPNSVQPPTCDDNFTPKLASLSPTYISHHPHYFHHQRHRGEKSPNSEDASSYAADSASQDGGRVNMYQTNLKMCAAEAMMIGNSQHSSRFRQDCHSQLISPTAHETVQWTDFSIAEGKRTPSINQHNSQLSSPTSVESHWISTKPLQNVPKSHSNVDIITYGQIQPYWEETKPYETSDFYKYSTKHRKQHQISSQNIQTKLSAWKVNQTNSQCLNAVPKVMSPVLERSRTASPACSGFWSNSNDPAGQSTSFVSDEKLLSENKRKEGATPTNFEPSEGSENLSDTFHKEMLEWLKKQEKGKKTTLV